MLIAFQRHNVASLSSNGVAKFIRPIRSLSAGNKDVIIGIDLGTTNSRVAVMNGEYPEVIVNSEGARAIPSVLAFDKGGNILTGSAAKEQSLTNIPNTIFSTKQFIGRGHVESYVPYKVVNAPNGTDIWVQGNGVDYSPSQIAAYLIKELKETAESYIRRPIWKAVITVPAHFDTMQRKATRDAGRIAGLDVTRLISEPNAAALSYGLLNRMEGTIVVFNMGGGRFDVSVLKVSNNSFEVQASKGCSLAGVDFDEALEGVLVNEFRQKYDIYIGNDTLAYERIREAAEKAKIQLSSASEANIDLPFLFADKLGAKHLNVTVTRKQFEMLVRSLTEKIKQICIQCLKEAGMASKTVDVVIAVGGMTKAPIVQSTISSIFGKNPIMDVDQDEAVVKGAAIQGGILRRDVKMYLRDATPLALDVHMKEFYTHTTCLIDKHTPIPFTKCHVHKDVDVNAVLYQRGSGLCERLGVFKTAAAPPRAVSTYNCGSLPKIKLTFHIDHDGILTVSAKEHQTQKQLQVIHEGAGGLSEEQIESMMLVTEEQKKMKLVRHFRETAAPSICKMEKSLNIYRQKVSEIESAVRDLRHELEGDDMEQIKAKLEAARNAISKIEKSTDASSSFSEDATANAVSDHEHSDDQNSDGYSNNDDSDVAWDDDTDDY